MLVILLNFSGASQTLPIAAKRGKRLDLVFSTGADAASIGIERSTIEKGCVNITLPAFTGLVFKENDIKRKIKLN